MCTYKSPADAKKAVREMNGRVLADGSLLTVVFAKDHGTVLPSQVARQAVRDFDSQKWEHDLFETIATADEPPRDSDRRRGGFFAAGQPHFSHFGRDPNSAHHSPNYRGGRGGRGGGRGTAPLSSSDGSPNSQPSRPRRDGDVASLDAALNRYLNADGAQGPPQLTLDAPPEEPVVVVSTD